MEHGELKAAVSLPQDLFTGVGVKAKTSILFLRKYSERERREVIRLKEASGAACVPHPKTLDHRVLMTSQRFSNEEVPLDAYLKHIRPAFAELQSRRGRS